MRTVFGFIFLLLLSVNSFAHGEDKPGPNGGFLRMPGAFHTELLPDPQDQSFHVSLLDLYFKNPTVKNSSLEMTLEQKRNKVNFTCKVMGGNHYHCVPDKAYKADSGKVTLIAKREDAKGTAVYHLPLSWTKKESTAGHQEMDHGKGK